MDHVASFFPAGRDRGVTVAVEGFSPSYGSAGVRRPPRHGWLPRRPRVAGKRPIPARMLCGAPYLP